MLYLIPELSYLQEEDAPYEFFVQDVNVKGTLDETLSKLKDVVTEKVLEITYQPQALFRVHPVTRCSSSIPGNIIPRVGLFCCCCCWFFLLWL